MSPILSSSSIGLFCGSDIVGIGNWETSTINAEQYFAVENVTER